MVGLTKRRKEMYNIQYQYKNTMANRGLWLVDSYYIQTNDSVKARIEELRNIHKNSECFHYRIVTVEQTVAQVD